MAGSVARGIAHLNPVISEVQDLAVGQIDGRFRAGVQAEAEQRAKATEAERKANEPKEPKPTPTKPTMPPDVRNAATMPAKRSPFTKCSRIELRGQCV